ncbi:MAG: insulinase family protein [Lachnospiraceae bacterium]|jgi:Zn-dependent M16 (insulinase) family peptidase|nr:insulinase family protein [Lachnospiraceae bacterium]
MKKSGLEQLSAYELIKEKEIKEMNSKGAVLRHKKTGAKLFLMINDDENKVFSIGFRTPPNNSTGLQHILEHSVLCGSEKFPVKDPFVELVKGSLNTFLNAMTYPDKTVYPVASCNEQDFKNLMDVYLDAVFHPNIYREPKIFMQEGWHYELEKEDGPITINGVVYNEMKGAFSSPESLLDRAITHELFPDTCYGFESGGDPSQIPNLTYEGFLDYHRQYYHPSNSYIYLYGNMDMEERLRWLDEAYLSKYEAKEIDSSIQLQKPFAKPVEKELFYSITEDEEEANHAYLSVNTVVETNLDPKRYVAFQILEYTLLDAPGAPLKQALVDAGIGDDVFGGYENGVLQPYFSVIAKNADADQKGEFLAVVKGTLRKIADQGIDKKSLLAGLNYYEFRYREADYGSAPKGLMYGLWCMDSWLYGGDPMMHLEYQETFDFLKKAVEEGYFEELIRTGLLDNPFEAVIALLPKKNLTAEEEQALAKKLAAYKDSLSPSQVVDIREQTMALREYQETPSSQEDLEKIPMLKREEIGREPELIQGQAKEEDGITVLYNPMFTSGIGYIQVLFDTKGVPQEDLPYVGLLKSVLGYVDTEHYSYSDLTSEIYLNSGGIDFSVVSYADLREPGKFTGVFSARAKVLSEKLDFAFDILGEILTRSKLEDEKRLGEILAENKSRARMRLENASHSAAVARATSYFSPTSAFNDVTGGIGYYHFLEKLCADFEKPECRAGLISKLKEVVSRLFVRDHMMVAFTAEEEACKKLPKSMARLADLLAVSDGKEFPFVFRPCELNEGFKTSSQVNYVARCGSFENSGLSYTGALKILKVILNYDYLWQNLRVQGGAYGCMSGFGRSKEGYLVSYRDPNIKETNQVYEKIPEYIRQFNAQERDMTKYVIGAIGELDVPLTPSIKGAREVSAYLSGVTNEMLKEERKQILDATQEDIRSLAPIVEALLNTGSLCVIGNEEKVKAEAGMFEMTLNLFH